MKLQMAAELAHFYFTKYGLYENGWRFEFDGGLRRFGSCQYSSKTITLSAHLTTINSEEHVKDTILHEIAHALAGPNHRHDRVWKKIARELGCSAVTTFGSEVVLPKGKWQAVCPNCKKVYHRYRKPSRKKTACRDCCIEFNNGIYAEDFYLKFKEVV